MFNIGAIWILVETMNHRIRSIGSGHCRLQSAGELWAGVIWQQSSVRFATTVARLHTRLTKWLS